MKIKKILASLLMACILFNSTVVPNITAKATSFENDIFYYDGVGFKTSLDDNGNLTVKSLSSGKDSAYITVHKDGSAEAQVCNNSVVEKYDLKMKDFSDKKINVDVYQKGNKVKNYSNLNELKYDKYMGQSGVVELLIYSLSLLLDILLTLAITAIVVGVTYYSAAYVIEKVKAIAIEMEDEMAYYYRASIVGPQVVIDLYNPITQAQATSRLATQNDIYTYFSSAAAYACQKVGNANNCIGPEITENRKAGYVYFFHYHINRTNPAHAFFGFPYTL